MGRWEFGSGLYGEGKSVSPGVRFVTADIIDSMCFSQFADQFIEREVMSSKEQKLTNKMGRELFKNAVDTEFEEIED